MHLFLEHLLGCAAGHEHGNPEYYCDNLNVRSPPIPQGSNFGLTGRIGAGAVEFIRIRAAPATFQMGRMMAHDCMRVGRFKKEKAPQARQDKPVTWPSARHVGIEAQEGPGLLQPMVFQGARPAECGSVVGAESTAEGPSRSHLSVGAKLAK